MTRWRMGLVLVAAVVAVTLVVGTSGYTAANTDRGVRVAVVDDDAAYVGVEQTATDTANGTTNLTVAVTNQFPTSTVLGTVTVTVDGRTVALTQDGPLGPGKRAVRTFQGLPCDATITVGASGTDVDVQFSRPVDC